MELFVVGWDWGEKTDNFTWKGLKKLEGWNCSLWDWIGDEH